MGSESSVFGRKAKRHQRRFDLCRQLHQLIAGQSHPQYFWTSEVGKYSQTFSTYGAGRKESHGVPECCGNRFDLRFGNIAEELERQMKVFFPEPADFGYARF